MRIVLAGIMMVMVVSAMAQRIYRGIVVDSATLVNLPDVHVTVKNTTRGAVTNAAGTFIIYAQPADTLLFTSLGYKPLVLPLLFEEDAMMIMMSENIKLLSGVIIRSTRLYPNKIEDRTSEAPKILDPINAFISPFDYFWKLEREKRKLAKLVEENNRTQTYRQVITDPDVKDIITKAYHIDEERYFELLIKFNRERLAVQYFTDPDRIMEELHDFFEEETNQ